MCGREQGRGEGRTDGNDKYSKLRRSGTKTREGERERREKRGNCRTGGGMCVEVDGWMKHGKYRESRAGIKERAEKKKPVNLCLVNPSIHPAGGLSPAAETI